MEKCFQMCSATRASHVVLNTHRQFDNMTNVFKPPMIIKKPSSSTLKFTSSSSAQTFSNWSRFICQSAVNEVKVVTDSTWNDLMETAAIPVLVEFWAPWCGPCRMIAPVVDGLAKEYAGKALCYKINTDDCPNIASKYGIRSISTVLFFKNGEKKESVIGAVQKSILCATLDENRLILVFWLVHPSFLDSRKQKTMV